MEDLHPYIVLEDTPGRLKVEEPKWRQNVMLFVFRVLPVIYLLSMSLMIYTAEQADRRILILFAVVMAFPLVVLLNISYPTKIEITPLYITLHLKTLQNENVKSIMIADIEKILIRKKRGKARGLFYYLIFKVSGKRQRFLSFRGFYMRDAKRDYVNRKLVSITNLPVENK